MSELGRITSKEKDIKYKIEEIEPMGLVTVGVPIPCYKTSLYAKTDAGEWVANLHISYDWNLRPRDGSLSAEFDGKFKETLLSAVEHALFYGKIKKSDKPIVINVDDKGDNDLKLKFEYIDSDKEPKYDKFTPAENYDADLSYTAMFEILNELNNNNRELSKQILYEQIFFDKVVFDDSFERLLNDNDTFTPCIRKRDNGYIITEYGKDKMKELKKKIGRKEQQERSIGF